MSGHVEQLRQLLAPASERRLLTVPGCWDALSALLIQQAGFPLAFISGGAVAMTRLGRADVGLVTATEAAEAVAMIRDRVEMPLIADGDTGFGNALTLQRAVRDFERAGASAITIEDQSFPKRCGHMAGKAVVPRDEAVGRIKAALDARHEMLVTARTDALAVEGLASALDRAEAFIEAGADLVFIEGPCIPQELEQIASAFAARVPLVYNLVRDGTTRTESAAALEALGFAVALHPLLLLSGFVRQAPKWLAHLRKESSTTAIAGDIVTVDELNAFVGAAELMEFGNRYDRQD